MRAAVLHGPNDLRVDDVDVPVPGPGEVVLRIRSATTCATDVKMFQRGHPALGPYPARLGHEFAGVVEACGPGVTAVAPGDAVFCADSAPCGRCVRCGAGRANLCDDLMYLLGGFAEQVLVPARIASVNMHRLPDGLAMEQAPMAEPLACALLAVDRVAPQKRQEVIVLGAGSMGLFLTAALRARECDPIVFDPHPERLALATRFGAVATLEAQRSHADVERAQVHHPRHVFEAVGRPDAWELAVQMVEPGGTVMFVGGCERTATVQVPTFRVHYEEVTLRGSYHHTPTHIGRALELLTDAAFDWAALVGPAVGLDALGDLLHSGRPSVTGHLKQLVDPSC